VIIRPIEARQGGQIRAIQGILCVRTERRRRRITGCSKKPKQFLREGSFNKCCCDVTSMSYVIVGVAIAPSAGGLMYDIYMWVEWLVFKSNTHI